MSDSINGLNRLSAGSQGYKPKGRPGSETDRRISGTTDSVTVGRPFEENNVIPAPEVKSVPVCDKPALAGLVESEKYLNAIDATAPMLPPTVQMAINPPGQDLSFSKIVAGTNYHEPYVGDPARMVDPKGDAHLIRRLDSVPVKLMSALLGVFKNKLSGKGFKESPGAVKKTITIGRQKPINVDALLNKVVQVIQENPDVKPTLGEEHQWSPGAKKYNRLGFFRRLGRFITGKQGPPAPLLFRSKLFLSLACGWTRTYLPTGKEDQLENRLMKYDDKSVRLEDVFRESYLLNDGNLYKTMLTAENVLAKNVYSKDRDSQPLQKKLQYIRNDSEPEGDNFGGWYHFMGASLYGLMRPAPAAKAVMLTEALGSVFLEGPDRQETHINVAGSDFGSGLRRMMKEETWKTPLPQGADTKYMNLNEFKQGS